MGSRHQEFTMSALPDPQQFYSLDDYYALDTSSDQRHEYYRGDIYAMSGGSADHDRIALDTAATLTSSLAGKPCEVFVADLRLLIKRRLEDLSDTLLLESIGVSIPLIELHRRVDWLVR